MRKERYVYRIITKASSRHWSAAYPVVWLGKASLFRVVLFSARTKYSTYQDKSALRSSSLATFFPSPSSFDRNNKRRRIRILGSCFFPLINLIEPYFQYLHCHSGLTEIATDDRGRRLKIAVCYHLYQ